MKQANAEKLERPGSFQPYLIWIFAILLAVPVAVFLRPGFFFVWDDWTALLQLTHDTFWNYVTQADGEQWFPTFRLVYFSMVKVFGESYSLMLLLSCMAAGINAFLIFLFLRRRWPDGTSLTFSLLYAMASVHKQSAWMAYLINYEISLGFFLGALVLTDRYIRSPSFLLLVGIGLCEWFSITAHNFALMSVSAIPLYALLAGAERNRREFWRLAFATGLIYLLFTIGYLTYAGKAGASSQNHEILSNLPGPAFLVYWFYGSFLYPICYLFGGGLGPVATAVVGAVLLAASLFLIFFRGEREEKRLALWALLFNALPFILVGLARYKFALIQAGNPRYGIFTLVGAVILMVTAWRIVARHIRSGLLNRVLPVLFLVVLFAGQALNVLLSEHHFRTTAATALRCYQELDAGVTSHEPAGGQDRKFCTDDVHPFLTRNQAMAIRNLLKNNCSSP
ncbi:MAG: hypothetical protein WAN11_00275 [Syntrophobacteraceae bacterium]